MVISMIINCLIIVSGGSGALFVPRKMQAVFRWVFTSVTFGLGMKIHGAAADKTKEQNYHNFY